MALEISDTMNDFAWLHVYPALPPKVPLTGFQTKCLMNIFPHENRFLMKHLSTASGPSRHSLGEISQKQASGANSTAFVPVTFSLIPFFRRYGSGKASSDSGRS